MIDRLTLPARLLLLWALFTAGAAAQDHIDAVIRARAATLKRSELKPAEKDGFAVVQPLTPPAQPIKDPDSGWLSNAIIIRTPEVVEGPVLVMFFKVNEAHFANETFNGWIMPLEPDAGKDWEENRVFGYYSHFAVSAFRTLHERFPQSSNFMVERVPLKPSTDYIVAFSSNAAALPNFGVALTVHSKEGYKTYGSLPTGLHVHMLDDPPTARQESEATAVAGMIADNFRGGQYKEGLEALEAGTKAYYEDGGTFPLLYQKIIEQSRDPGSATSTAWDVSLWHWLFLEAREQSYDFEAELCADQMIQRQVNRNRSATLIDALRFMSRQFGNAGMNQYATKYPDLGPGLAGFPEARKRDIAKQLHYGTPRLNRSHFVYMERDFEPRVARMLDALSQKHALNGAWQDALEWQLWARDCTVDGLKKDKPDPALEELWFSITWRIALILTDMGFYEAADTEYAAIIERPWNDDNAWINRNNASLRRIELALLKDPAKKGLLPQLDKITGDLTDLQKLPDHLRPWVDCLRARCLIAEGRDEEAMKLLEPRIAEEHFASLELKVFSDAAKGKAKAAELNKMLGLFRGIGMSREEGELYDAAADQAEHDGRVSEANALRLIALQSAQGFTRHPLLRIGEAKLAASVARHGDSELATLFKKETEALLGDATRTPPYIKDQTTQALTAKLAVPGSAKASKPAALVPSKAQLGKMENGARSISVSLTNWNDVPLEGSLKFDGLPVEASYKEAQRAVDVSVAAKAGTTSIEKIRLIPGLPIAITLKPAADAPLPGRVTVTWSSPGQADQTSVCEFTNENLLLTATLKADEWLSHPFHGTKLRFDYHLGLKDEERAAIRAIASKPARIEVVVTARNKPLFVDDQGNGSVEDPGDVLFAFHTSEVWPSLGTGTEDYPLRLRILPKEPVGKDGLEVTLMQHIGGIWTPFALYRIEP